ncbi:MAG: hypothetical protein GY822_11440 [Deltaproteobacteria bacterium]|nr:hypothetical protein [Deltaproteobacteria bacterium]
MFFFYLLSQLLVFVDLADDPVHEAWQGRQAARQFECERMSQARAHEKFPGRIPATSARGTALFQIDALVCERRVIPDGTRTPRDELILGNFNDEIGELSGLAAKVGDKNTRWIVDAYYPDSAMVQKIAGATRVSLAERGLFVSDQPPIFTGGDVEVFRTLPVRYAIPLACKRLFDTHSLDDNTAFLAIALLHEKESQLHAGICQHGKFTWLR